MADFDEVDAAVRCLDAANPVELFHKAECPALCRSWQTARAMWCTCGSGTALCSGAIRKVRHVHDWQQTSACRQVVHTATLVTVRYQASRYLRYEVLDISNNQALYCLLVYASLQYCEATEGYMLCEMTDRFMDLGESSCGFCPLHLERPGMWCHYHHLPGWRHSF